MSLDMLALGSQVRAMARDQADDSRMLADRIAAAQKQLAAEAADWEFWSDAIEAAHAQKVWLVAKPLEPMDTVYAAPACPREYSVAAADGSQIDLDSHGTAECWVINIGRAALTYGAQAAFRADTRPTLGYGDDLTIRDQRSEREQAVTGEVLAARRDLFEGFGLVESALSLPSELPRIALMDGPLIRWTLGTLDPWLKDRFLQDQLSYLETMRALPCPLASYWSRPRSSEVAELARFLHLRGDVERWRSNSSRQGDNPYRGVRDHLLFSMLLADGQRSARFQSMSRINVVDYPHPHTIQFFYLKVGREIARVEFPAWVAEHNLDLLHAIVYDQCQRGAGYPVAVQRAHEQAVIHEGDRRQLQALIARLFAAVDVPAARSAKAISKLRPGL